MTYSAFFSPVIYASAVTAESLREDQWRLQGAHCHLSVRATSSADQVHVEHIYDGDTVRLSDGRTVRLLGVNTPELSSQGGHPQAHAVTAKSQLRQVLDSQSSWFLLLGQRSRDRYGRWLGYLLDSTGRSLASVLLARGAGMMIAKFPDSSHSHCFKSLERMARRDNKGLWAEPYWAPYSVGALDRDDVGFRLVRGRVTKVEFAGDVYIDLDDHLVVRFTGAVAAALAVRKDLLGELLEVRGWIVRRELTDAQRRRGFKEYVMVVSNEHELEVVR